MALPHHSPDINPSRIYVSVNPSLKRLPRDAAEKKRYGTYSGKGWIAKPQPIKALAAILDQGGAVAAVFAKGHRNDANLLTHGFFAVDIDAPKIDELRSHPFTQRYQVITGKTPSGNCRAIIPVDAGINASTEQARADYKALANRILYAYADLKPDPTSNEPARFFFGFQTGTTAISSGERLTLADVLALPEPPAPISPKGDKTVFVQRERRQPTGDNRPVNPRLIDAIESALLALGFTYNTNEAGRWLNGPSLFRADKHPSFGVNLSTGYGWDFGGRSHTTAQICRALGIRIADYGGLYEGDSAGVTPATRELPDQPTQAGTLAGGTQLAYENVPDEILAAAYKYLPKTTPACLWLLNALATDGMINAEGFTLADVLALQERYGFALSERTWADVLTAVDGVFLRKINGREKCPILQSDFRKNPNGRPAATYELTPIDTHADAILRRAAYRIYENAGRGKDGELEIIVEPRPRMFEALGFDASEAVDIAAQLNQQLQPVFEQQGHAEKRAARAALDEFTALQFSLQNPVSTPIKPGWMITNARDFQAARLRGWIEATPEGQRSYEAMARFLGVERSSIPAHLKRAGIENIPQFAERPMLPSLPIVEQARRAGAELNGKPYEIVARYGDNRIAVIDYGATPIPDVARFVANHTAKGAEVVLKLRVASKQAIIDADQEGPTIINRPTPEPTTAPPAERPTPPAREWGENYGIERFILPWLVLALQKSGYNVQRDGKIADADGGYVVDQPDARTLLDVLLNGLREAKNAPSFELPAFMTVAIEMGATIKRRALRPDIVADGAKP